MMNGNYGPGLTTTDSNDKRKTVGWQGHTGYIRLVKTKWGGYIVLGKHNRKNSVKREVNRGNRNSSMQNMRTL